MDADTKIVGKAKTLRMTCWACPSMWEGEFDDGRSFYIRYRYGRLTLFVGNALDVVHFIDCGDPFDGLMSGSTMTRMLQDWIDFSGVELSDYDRLHYDL